MTEDNPYQAPRDAVPVVRSTLVRITPWVALRTLALWILICGVSAIPSFVMGMQVAQHPHRAFAMSLGVFIFAVGYTLVDLLFLHNRAKRNPALRLALFTGYIARMVVSVLFPIGIMIDVWTGFASVAIVSGIGAQDTVALNTYTAICLATILQGVFLNVILVAFMLLLYGLLNLFGVQKQKIELGCIEPN